MSMSRILFVSLLVIACSVSAQVDPGIRDTLKLDSVSAIASSGRGIVPVRFYNDQQLSGVEVTLKWDHPDVTIDSFSFVGSRIAYANLKGAVYTDSTVTAYAFPFTGQPVVSAGNGLLGTLYLRYPSSVGDVLIRVDSTSLANGIREYTSTFSTSTSIPFNPLFKTGFVNVVDTVCCIGNRGDIDGQLGDDPNVADITYLVSYLFMGGAAPPCTEEGNADGIIGAGGQIDVADLTFMVSFVFMGGPAPGPCPNK
jgi:hypothetical protein